MQHSYSLADISVCIPYWVTDGNYLPLFATVRSVVEAAEISLCDDGSSHGLAFPAHSRPVKTVRLPRKSEALNPCVPINRAVAASTLPVIVLTNPGVEIAPGMLERMLSELDDETYVAAACRDADTGRWLCHSTVRGGEYGRGQMPRGSGFHFLAMLTRSLWDKAGGFDEDYREGQGYDDNDFLWRLHRAGAKFKVLDDVVIEHKRSTTQWPEGGLARNKALFEQKWPSAA